MQHVLTVPMPRPPMSANDQRRMHWAAQAKAKKQVGEAARKLAQQAGLQDLGPSVVSVTWYAPDKRRRDTDSLGPFLKAALDGLVQAGVWPDDHSDYVVETRMAINKSQVRNPRIEIKVIEANAGSGLA
ncbi:RusA-like Holliday junction resolvase [Mycobacterium phage DyoEdafos]|uniref:RusA-like resolvase n=1 Tax=Mycobacterium phage DyoEdafos TaxID=2599860 RepID=A0A5J6THQ6_9CAUD|nr:RusA-like Holliday junction resolvase [Mycobacterium phage DyoEdafos]QFG10310.1 RusA-like resolvase [Mycobacterium phage DyoEdafos]